MRDEKAYRESIEKEITIGSEGWRELDRGTKEKERKKKERERRDKKKRKEIKIRKKEKVMRKRRELKNDGNYREEDRRKGTRRSERKR